MKRYSGKVARGSNYMEVLTAMIVFIKDKAGVQFESATIRNLPDNGKGIRLHPATPIDPEKAGIANSHSDDGIHFNLITTIEGLGEFVRGLDTVESLNEQSPMLTYNELAAAIMKMTPEQRLRPAVVAMQQTGEVAAIESLCPIMDFNGTELPEQMVLWYNKRDDAPIF